MRAALVLALAVTGAVASATPAPAAPVAVGPISGWVADGDSGQPLDGICVVFYSVDGSAWDGATVTNGDGFWTFTPAVSGAQRIAVFRPTSAGDCSSLPLASGPVPEWVFDVSLTPADPLKATPPPEAATISDGTDRVDVCLGDTKEFRGGCDRKLTGKGTLSGSVVKTGPQPVVGACIYVFTDVQGDSDVGWSAMTDANGQWQVSGLPTDRKHYIGVVAPFVTSAGPCQTENGPPPTPPAGELQPEFYANVWVDLGSPDLDSDPAGYAAKNGAVAVAANTTDVDVCLTTETGTAPRPECAVTTSDTTTPTTAGASATAAAPGATGATEVSTATQAPPATATTGTLPLTGRDPVGPAAVGAGLLVAGLAAVLASRRRLRRT